MSINKNLLWSSFIYLFVINIPVYVTAFFASSVTQLIFILIVNCLGASLLIYLYYLTTSGDEIKQIPLNRVVRGGMVGIVILMMFQLVSIWLSQHLLKTELTVGLSLPTSRSNLDYLALLVPVLFVPIMEEVVFRFSLIHFLNQKLPVILSVLLSSVLFALMHGGQHILVLTGLGVLLSGIYYYSKSILSPIVAHVGMNALVIFLNL